MGFVEKFNMRYWERYDRRYRVDNILNLCSSIRSNAKKLGNFKISPYDYLFSLYPIYLLGSELERQRIPIYNDLW